MTDPPVPPGFTRFLMQGKFGAGRDFLVLDPETEEQLYLVDGKLGPRAKAEVLDASGAVLYIVRGHLISIPKKLTILDGAGTKVAVLKAKSFSMIKERMDLEMASGEPWQVEGTLREKDYTVTSGGRVVVRISQKWLTVRDKYSIEVADGVEVGLAFAVVWAIDRWVERR